MIILIDTLIVVVTAIDCAGGDGGDEDSRREGTAATAATSKPKPPPLKVSVLPNWQPVVCTSSPRIDISLLYVRVCVFVQHCNWH